MAQENKPVNTGMKMDGNDCAPSRMPAHLPVHPHTPPHHRSHAAAMTAPHQAAAGQLQHTPVKTLALNNDMKNKDSCVIHLFGAPAQGQSFLNLLRLKYCQYYSRTRADL
jgi:hypothetical protein